MVNHVKQNYVNPLTMMKSSKQEKHFHLGKMNTDEKRQKALEAKKQSIQNSLLLLKGGSGNGEASEESIELLEKKLEEVTNEIMTNRQVSSEGMEEKEELIMQPDFDRYTKKENEESMGCYRVVREDDRDYKIEYGEVD